MYNPENENRIFDEDTAKTIFYARSVEDVKESEMRVTTESLKRQHEREIKGLKV